MHRILAAALAATLPLLAMAPSPARAHRNDISLRGLGCSVRDGLGRCLADSNRAAFKRYRLLSSEVVAALSPRPMQPAETLGVSGFEFSLVSTVADISEEADYWRGQPGNPVLEGAAEHGVPTALWVPAIHVRKGLPFSMEVGATATYMAFSEIFAFGAEWKLAIHESFWRHMPAFSLRAAVSRVAGSSDLDIFTAEAGVMASLPVGIGGMLQATPYVGYGHLMAQINSQIIDETPDLVGTPSVPDSSRDDQGGGPQGSLFSYPTLTWTENQFPRLYGGLRINVAMLALLYEIDVIWLPLAGKKLTSHSIKLGFDV